MISGLVLVICTLIVGHRPDNSFPRQVARSIPALSVA